MSITIRPLSGHAERQACVRLQEATWGRGFVDQVPPSILLIAHETGGVASGAFEGDRMVGFVFGLTGLRDRRLVHWSDMLAVLPSHRNRNIGLRLKLHQRELLLPLGVETILWTFDPLVSRNAYLNLRRLGAIARSYKRDFYGRTDSPLHQGIGTDRLLAEWWIAGDRVRDRLADGGPAPARREVSRPDVPAVNPPELTLPLPRPGETLTEPSGPAVGIAIPADIETVRAADPELARAWRRNVRDAFERCFQTGYTAVDVVRGDATSSYVLTRGLSR